MRVLGLTLLFIGFAWLCASAVLWRTTITAVTSDTLGLTGQRESFERQEVFDILYIQRRELRQRIPSIVIPGLLMLCGGILLWRPPHRPMTTSPPDKLERISRERGLS